ncbi:hypothetical protein F5888DRAFT_547973 [Russula emetica]|nr:hypothetical protein F5888DRAFT_547538 [Russula emetica]KAF8483228.1 hypothetical protein F5888DRAFT_547973 [Russula emetica]
MYLRLPSYLSRRALFSSLVCSLFLFSLFSLLCAFSFHLARHLRSRNCCPQRPCQHHSFSISYLPLPLILDDIPISQPPLLKLHRAILRRFY